MTWLAMTGESPCLSWVGDGLAHSSLACPFVASAKAAPTRNLQASQQGAGDPSGDGRSGRGLNTPVIWDGGGARSAGGKL